MAILVCGHDLRWQRLQWRWDLAGVLLFWNENISRASDMSLRSGSPIMALLCGCMVWETCFATLVLSTWSLTECDWFLRRVVRAGAECNTFRFLRLLVSQPVGISVPSLFCAIRCRSFLCAVHKYNRTCRILVV